MSKSVKNFHLTTASSLEKIFPDEVFELVQPYTSATMLLGERFSFQAVYCLEADKIVHGSVTADGLLAEHVLLRRTGYAPSELPCYPDTDDFVLRTQPGLYPDPLYPLNEKLTMLPGQWNSLWITIPANCPLGAGEYDLILQFKDEEEKLLGECTFTLVRLAASLPEQTLLHTEWFHTDCIADWYQTPVFSERWWELTEQYAQTAACYGVNMLLTPLFTPPLDTQPGGERTTVQLVDVYYGEKGYSFGFDKLEQWLSMCERCGITNLEFSHLFTQWGAKHTPKIMVTMQNNPTDTGIVSSQGTLVKRFGWETDAASPEYREFLDAFLPQLVDFIHSHDLTQRCYFHISDEPHKEHLPSYLLAKELIQSHIGEMPIMDAISDYDFYEQGIIKLPVCSNDHIEPFLEHKVPNLWTYYCCSQYKEVSNRFFCMPSVRNRILGVQLYYYGIRGFLQWGFNFWNTALSTQHINPFGSTDAGRYFPSGDAFLVYPGENGPIASIRAEVLMEALQDMRAFQMLERLEGRGAAKRLIEETLKEPLTFRRYPHDSQWLLSLRQACNHRIALLI